MVVLAERRTLRAVPHIIFIALIAAGIAGCSAESTRFNDNAFASPYARNTSAQNEPTGSVARNQGAPVPRIETQQLPPPRNGSSLDLAPGRSDVTGSVAPNAAPAARANWQWEGGTAITVNRGDTLESISHRYGVPASAIMQANSISAPASIKPGQRLVIPRYSYNSGAPHSVAPATRVASNSTVVPVAVGAPAVARPNAPPPLNTGGVHVVVAGESMSSIARRYHKPRKLIAKANNIEPDAKLRIGQHLNIPGVKPVPPALAAAPVNKPAAPGPALQRTAEANAAPKTPGVSAAAGATNGKTNAPPGANVHVSAPAAEPTIEQTVATTPGDTTSRAPSFRWPVRGRIITGFGPKTNGQQNDGINLAVPEGTSVKAAEDGVVAYAGNELKGYGNLILVRHGNGFVTAYAHASELMVKRGDPVKRGQIIARAGQTGTVSSPQLHFEIRKGASPVDPTQYLSGT
jgi:murein DD-endopeptidase MepM/ murein hydrolase activator NlpD